MHEDLLSKIMNELDKEFHPTEATNSKPIQEKGEKNKMNTNKCNITEFVGTSSFGDTIGLVIANVDSSLLEAMNVQMNLEKKYRSIGIIGSRTGAGPHIMAADEAVKASNTEIVAIECPRDTKGGAGHGVLIIFGGDDVSDVKRAVEVTLEEVDTRTFGDVYGNEAGHIEMQYTARASYACNKAWGAPVGKAFGLCLGAPAAIGVVMCDIAAKAANIEIISYCSPAHGTSFSNEAYILITGDSGAVRQAVISSRDVGIELLGTLGSKPVNDQPSYI